MSLGINHNDYDSVVEADFSIELGTEDPTLCLPWADAESGLRYYDLKRRPDLLLNIQEAIHFPELGEFLAAVNSPASRFESAKCDAWFTTDLNPEDELFGAAGKFGSYVDFIFSDAKQRSSFPEHELLARQLTQLLKRVPEIPAAAEIMVRRACYHSGEIITDGFYFTLYVFGYGYDAGESRQRWAIALKLTENALRQLSSM